MAGHRKFSELRARMAPERRARNAADTARLLADMPLGELRQARTMTQATLAELLETTQGEVSKIERRTDMYVSTLRRYIEAMGGELEIVARFGDGAVRITQFHDAPDAQETAR
jgi:transcriptional regulator